jgi:hypothetical protein
MMATAATTENVSTPSPSDLVGRLLPGETLRKRRLQCSDTGEARFLSRRPAGAGTVRGFSPKDG